MANPGLSVRANQINAIAANQGFPVLLESYQAMPKFYPQFCEVVEGTVEALQGRFPDMPKGHKESYVLGMGRPKQIMHGQPFPSDTMKGGYSPQSACRKMAESITFTREDFQAQHPMEHIGTKLNAVMKGWGETFVASDEQLVADYLQKGTISAGRADVFQNNYDGRTGVTDGLIYDGKALFATDHPQDDGSGATYANLTVSAELTTANLEAGLLLMSATNAKNGRGERIIVKPNRLVIPPILKFRAATLLTTQLLPGSANNDANVSQMDGTILPIVNPYLTDDAAAVASAAWWLMEAGKGIVVAHTGQPQIEVTEDLNAQTVTVNAWKYIMVLPYNWRFMAAFNKATT